MKYQALRPHFFSVGGLGVVGWGVVGGGWLVVGLVGGGGGGVGMVMGWVVAAVLVRDVVGGGQRVGSV